MQLRLWSRFAALYCAIPEQHFVAILLFFVLESLIWQRLCRHIIRLHFGVPDVVRVMGPQRMGGQWQSMVTLCWCMVLLGTSADVKLGIDMGYSGLRVLSSIT